jgi:hypothetical protein
MPKVKTENLKEGMVVSADIKNLDDMLLIPSGAQLSPRHIKILMTWGINEVQVEATEDGSQSDDPMATIDPEVLEKIKAETLKVFRSLDESSKVQQEIFRLVTRRRVMQTLADGTHGSTR